MARSHPPNGIKLANEDLPGPQLRACPRRSGDVTAAVEQGLMGRADVLPATRVDTRLPIIALKAQAVPLRMRRWWNDNRTGEKIDIGVGSPPGSCSVGFLGVLHAARYVLD